MSAGRVEGIYLVETHGGSALSKERATAVPGRGLEGDRHFRPLGEPGHDLTLIQAEAIEGLAEDRGILLAPGECRRNVVTRGVSLNGLVGKRFRVGGIECRGEELCEPCRHLESLTQRGVLRGLVHRGGLCAEVISGGELAVGDAVSEIPG